MNGGASILAWTMVAAVVVAGAQAEVPAYDTYTLQVHDPGGGDHSQSAWYRDLDGDGRRDVISLLTAGQVRVFRLGPEGYPATAGETWTLPETAAWLDVADVTDDPGLEVLIGTTRGIACYRQRAGRFVPEPVTLAEAEQVFAQATVRWPHMRGWFRSLAGEKYERGLPVVQAGRVVLWQREPDGGYTPGEAVELTETEEVNREPVWLVGRWNELYEPRWAAGDASPRWLNFARKADDPSRRQKRQSNEPAQRLLDHLAAKGNFQEKGMSTDTDIDGDGRNDALLFLMQRELHMKTAFHLLLRRADGQLPEQADQVLNVNGAPVAWAPLVDVDADGRGELLTIEMRDLPTSMRAAAEMLLAGQVDCTLVVRRFDGKRFVPRPAAQMDLKAVPGFPVHVLAVNGDFNGDGRPDLRVFTSPTRVEVYLSAPGGRGLFERQAQLRFDAPGESYIDEVLDLNGDGLADVTMYERQSGRLRVYVSRKGAGR